MLTRCPNCGAGMSLDALIAHEECRQLLAEVMQVGLPYGRAVIRYLGLFRPAKRELRMERVARLLRELLPDLQRGAITRAGRDWPLTPEQWQAGLQAVLDAADKGTLKIKLANNTDFTVDLSKANADGDSTTLSAKDIAAAINAEPKNNSRVTASVITIGGVAKLVLTSNVSGEEGALTLDAGALLG